MRIVEVRAWQEAVPLTRPYTIAFQTVSSVALFFVELRAEGGLVGLGCASPAPAVTGESPQTCGSALLDGALDWLLGRDARTLGANGREAATRVGATPAAAAAIDMALHDLFARAVGVPLVDLLGRCHASLPTSITIGIQGVEETLDAADEYLGRGFRALKVKIGLNLEQDIERLRCLRERAGAQVALRVDGNQGYTLAETKRLLAVAEDLAIELVEQPVPAADLRGLASEGGLSEWGRSLLAADESLLDETDAMDLASTGSCGIFNIKLMKCGGVSPGLAIAGLARAAGLSAMWGCMDESVISIAAALHAAYASPATRYIDLDGSFDLAADPARGGFALAAGRLELLAAPGLGVELTSRST